jgi:hypothetical protein
VVLSGLVDAMGRVQSEVGESVELRPERGRVGATWMKKNK